jgi:Reverse transcriptase (RNA-dependent DNA polymerase)
MIMKFLQMNVKIAFLNGVLDEDVYMIKPDGSVDSKMTEKVCEIEKLIYGLKYLGVRT